jgi:predicted ATP-grasp superfamily ATP-dependent carboligase
VTTPHGVAERGSARLTDAGAVVVGGDYQGLGIVRSLGRRGIPAVVVDDEPSIARFSRYTTRTVRSPSLREDSGAIQALLQVGERFRLKGWVVYATRDEVVAAIARARPRLTELFRIPTPSWETIRYADDKKLTYRLADELGIPTPRTWYPRTSADLDRIEPTRWPLLIKPAVKEHFIYVTGVKAWPVRDRSELFRRFDEACAILPEREIMVQDLIPGGGNTQFSYCAFFKDGESVGRMTARRWRQWPHDIGRSTTLAETTLVPTLVECSERFLRAIDYYGLVELEYKYDATDGRYKLLDVNTRTWGYHSIGAPAGVDFAFMLFADQVGLEVVPSEAAPGVKWMRVTTDVATSASELVHGRLRLGEYLRSLRDVDVEAVFSRDDPRPSIADLAYLPHLARTRRRRR